MGYVHGHQIGHLCMARSGANRPDRAADRTPALIDLNWVEQPMRAQIRTSRLKQHPKCAETVATGGQGGRN